MDATMFRPEPQDGFDEYDRQLWEQAEVDGFFDHRDDVDDSEPA